MSETVWVAVTVIPQAKAAHVETFDNQESAEEYADYAEENAPDSVSAWVASERTEVKEDFNHE